MRRGAAVNVAAARGVTPLHSAAREGFTRCVKALLDGGADVERRNEEGGTPLFSAAVRARKDTIALLVSHGANLDATTSFGTTPRNAMGKAMPAPLAALPMPPPPRLEPLPARAAIRAWIDQQRGGHPLLRDLLAARWQVLHDPRGRPGQLAAAPQVPQHGRSLFVFSEREAAEQFAHKIPGLPAGLVCTEVDGPELFFGLEEGHDEVVFDPPVTPLPFLFYQRPLLPTLHRVGTRLWLERELDRNATPRAALWELANRFKYRALLGATRNLITVEGGGRTLLPLFTNADAEAAFFAWLKAGRRNRSPRSPWQRPARRSSRCATCRSTAPCSIQRDRIARSSFHSRCASRSFSSAASESRLGRDPRSPTSCRRRLVKSPQHRNQVVTDGLTAEPVGDSQYAERLHDLQRSDDHRLPIRMRFERSGAGRRFPNGRILRDN